MKALLLGLCALSYFVAMHVALITPGGAPWALALVVVPLIFVGFKAALALGSPIWRGLALIALLGFVLLLIARWQVFALATDIVFLVQHAGTMAALSAVFAWSLLPGREPVISALARRIERNFDDDMAHYTRTLTFAWSLFFAAIALASLGLYAAGWHTAWSLLINLLTYPLIAIFFAIEFLIRRRRFAHVREGSLAEAFANARRAWEAR